MSRWGFLRTCWLISTIFNSLTSYVKQILRSWLIKEQGLIRSSTGYNLYYTNGSNEYCVKFSNRAGPTRFIKVVDENDKNVTDNIKSFYGISKNFHGIPTSPNLLGYKSLSFIMLGSEVKTFTGDEIIII
jgi:uncharacterized protein DUF5772